jgi:hypothetical protein
MQKAVKELLQLGPMPAETAADVETVEEWEKLLHQIQPPVSKYEAEALLVERLHSFNDYHSTVDYIQQAKVISTSEVHI